MIQYIKETLAGKYPQGEIQGFIERMFENVKGFSRLDLLLNKDTKLSESEVHLLKDYTARLTQREPIQYILGETTFYDLLFKVNPAVLIPRPETEELVHWVLQENGVDPIDILDVGTGSGCIPISIKKNRPNWKVWGLDISQEALQVAKGNAINNEVLVNWIHGSILKPESLEIGEGEKFNIIISNPPYVCQSEEVLMDANVLEHEPHLALFVSDEDPLVFYRAILAFSQDNLVSGGRVYFEINQALGQEMKALFEEFGFQDIILRKDLSGKDRMICGKK